jgi:hypothetical protein
VKITSSLLTLVMIYTTRQNILQGIIKEKKEGKLSGLQLLLTHSDEHFSLVPSSSGLLSLIHHVWSTRASIQHQQITPTLIRNINVFAGEHHSCNNSIIFKKPSSQFLGLIMMSYVRFEFESVIFLFYFSFTFVLYGESRLLVLWCAGGRCDMICRDEDCGRSRRPDAEDRRWSHRSGTR